MTFQMFEDSESKGKFHPRTGHEGSEGGVEE